MSGTARRARQAEMDAENETEMNRRPNIPPTPIPEADRCTARMGRHDFSMKGNDGQYRCWYCVRLKPAVTS